MGVAQLGFVATLGLVMRDDPPEVEIDHQRRLAAGTDDFELRFEPGHQRSPPIPFSASPSLSPSNCFLSSNVVPSGFLAFSLTSVICIRPKLNRWPYPVTNRFIGA